MYKNKIIWNTLVCCCLTIIELTITTILWTVKLNISGLGKLWLRIDGRGAPWGGCDLLSHQDSQVIIWCLHCLLRNNLKVDETPICQILVYLQSSFFFFYEKIGLRDAKWLGKHYVLWHWKGWDWIWVCKDHKVPRFQWFVLSDRESNDADIFLFYLLVLDNLLPWLSES